MKSNEMKKLEITEYGTIKNIYFNEMTFNDFLKKLNKKKNNIDYNLKYDNKNKQFMVIYKGEHYSFKLDDISMTNYELGNYDSITLKIKKLIDYFYTRDSKFAIIDKGNNREKLSTKEEIDVYINYLKHCNTRNILSILKVVGIPLINVSILVTAFIHVSYYYDIGSAILGNFLILALEYVVVVVVGLSIDNDIDIDSLNIINSIKKIKLNKMKINQLQERIILKDTKSINTQQFDKTLEKPIKEDLNEFSNAIMKEFSRLLNRVKYINSNNKDQLIIKIQTLMEEYISRYKNIIYSNKNGELSLKKDDLITLKNDITKKISEIEGEMINIRTKDVKVEQILKEKALLDAQIREIYKKENEEKQIPMTR